VFSVTDGTAAAAGRTAAPAAAGAAAANRNGNAGHPATSRSVETGGTVGLARPAAKRNGGPAAGGESRTR